MFGKIQFFENHWHEFHFCRRKIDDTTFASAFVCRREMIWARKTAGKALKVYHLSDLFNLFPDYDFKRRECQKKWANWFNEQMGCKIVANLLYLLYSTDQHCCHLHLTKQNYLVKTLVSLNLFSLVKLIWNCIIFL